MEQPFEINFDFPLANSDLFISLKATAELHHSDPYYVIEDFHLTSSKPGENNPSVLPTQKIKEMDRDGVKVWVHCDSKRESQLSIAMGKAIEKARGPNGAG